MCRETPALLAKSQVRGSIAQAGKADADLVAAGADLLDGRHGAAQERRQRQTWCSRGGMANVRYRQLSHEPHAVSVPVPASIDMTRFVTSSTLAVGQQGATTMRAVK